MKKVSQMREEEIIGLFKSISKPGGVAIGIGDDCALIERDEYTYFVITTDLLAENVHFRRDTSSAKMIGYKSLAVNLSDIAAMGAIPVSAFLSISLPGDLGSDWIEEYSKGVEECSAKYGCPLSGGDTAANSSQIFISFTVVGQVEKDKVLLRSGASPGDDIWYSGLPGLSHAGFRILENELSLEKNLEAAAMHAHLKPEPAIDLGMYLSSNMIASACMDCSDGISRDLERLCAASGCGAEITAGNLPLDGLKGIESSAALDAALHGGEDYNLLFTASPEKRRFIEKYGNCHAIGRIVEDQAIHLVMGNGDTSVLKPKGYEHFS